MTEPRWVESLQAAWMQDMWDGAQVSPAVDLEADGEEKGPPEHPVHEPNMVMGPVVGEFGPDSSVNEDKRR